MNTLHLSLAFVFFPQLVSYLRVHWNIGIDKYVFIPVFVN